MKRRKYRYDYYQVEVPGDAVTWDERVDMAIDEARERAHLYCTPCEWAIISERFDTMIVRRKRNA